MPIKKENRHRYPKQWKLIRQAILGRAVNRCEGSPKYPKCRAVDREPHPVTGSHVILTVAHLDHTPEHNEPENLRAWCQRCHLYYDREYHRTEARKTIEKKSGAIAARDAANSTVIRRTKEK